MIQQRSERVLETIPVGSLGIIPLPSCKELGDKVNNYLVQWQRFPVLVPVKQKELFRNLSADVIFI